MQQHTFITREALVHHIVELARNRPTRSTTLELSERNNAAYGAALFTLDVVKEASDACPTVPLQAVSSIALLLLDTAQATKDNEKNLLRLAHDSVELAFVIISHYHNTATGEWKSDMPDGHTEMLFRFVERAYSVYLMANRLHKRPLFKRFFTAKLDVDTITEFREILDHARHTFELEISLETNRNTRELQQMAALPSPTQAMPLETTLPSTISPPASPPPRPISQPPPVASIPPQISPTTSSYPSIQSSGSGVISYVNVGGNYTSSSGDVYNEHHNSGNTLNYAVQNSFNDALG